MGSSKGPESQEIPGDKRKSNRIIDLDESDGDPVDEAEVS